MRFLAWVTGGWIGLRVLLVWHDTGSLPQAIRDMAPLPVAQALASAVPPIAAAVDAIPVVTKPVAAMRPAPTPSPPSSSSKDARVEIALVEALAPLSIRAPEPVTAVPAARPSPQSLIAPVPLARATPASLSGSAWVIARGGTGIGAASGGSQLGGSQVGVRADYAIGRSLAITGRLAAPASGIGREAAIGIAWRPAGVPIRIVAEQRIALDSGRGGPAVGASGGVSDVTLPAGFRLEGYGQAGVVLREAAEPYADGSIRGARPIGTIAGIAIDAGGGAWGGAQRGAARLDIGPSLGARLPVESRTVRLTLDWRQRVAGTARPGSGPALSLGADF